jgi:lipoprotein-anchoring transpeptidase ErfK/SrfK
MAARPAIAAAVLALAAGGCGAGAAGDGATSTARSARVGPTSEAALGGASLRRAAAPARRAPPTRPRGRWAIARVVRPVALRLGPGGPVRARLRRRTGFGSPTTLAVVRRRGRWLGVVSPRLPNGRVGWIPAAAARLTGTDLSIWVDRGRHRLELRDRRRVLLRMPVAVGRPGHATPLGRFAVTDRLRTGDPASPYGCCAMALSGHQTHLPPGWPGGDRIAIHATPMTSSIGLAASLGCLRAPTAGVRLLMRRVPLGTPVFVRRRL